MTTLGVGSSDSNGDGYVTGADSTFAGSARRTNENDSQYGCDLTAAEADYSDDLNRNEINYTTSNGAVQNSLISDIVAAQLKFEKDVITELNKLSLAKAEAELARAVKIAEQQKINAVGAVHEEYGDVLTGPFDPSRIMWTGVAVADADKTMIDATADAQATFESTVAALKETLDSTVAARKKQAEKAAAKLVGQLEKDNAADLADYNTAQTDAANDHFTEQTDIFVDWRSADYGAQVTALAWLNTATQIPWTQYLQDKAVCIAAWWADEGADLYTDWAADVCTEYSTYTESVNAAYTTMVTTIADARDAYHDDTPESDDPGTDPGGDPAGMLPVKRDFDAAAAAAQQAADADADYQKALAAANLQLALDNDAAGTDQQALAAAQAAYDSTVAAALLAYQQSVTDAQGDQSLADAQAVDDYVDEVYGDDGAYETWQNAVSGAEEAYKLAESAAKETLTKNLAALDAALEAALADTYADALELLATNHPSPWATRAAADARAESNKIASEQAAKQTYDEAVATAQADFSETVAAAEQTRADAQTDAFCALKTTLSDENVEKAEAEQAKDNTAAEDEVSTKKPDEQTPPDAPEDVSAIVESVIVGAAIPKPDECTSLEWFEAMKHAHAWAQDNYAGDELQTILGILRQMDDYASAYYRAREAELSRVEGGRPIVIGGHIIPDPGDCTVEEWIQAFQSAQDWALENCEGDELYAIRQELQEARTGALAYWESQIVEPKADRSKMLICAAPDPPFVGRILAWAGRGLWSGGRRIAGSMLGKFFGSSAKAGTGQAAAKIAGTVGRDVVEEAPSRLGRWFARYGDDGVETFSARLSHSGDELVISWTENVRQIAPNIAQIQSVAGKNIPRIVGKASAGVEEAIKAGRFNSDLYAKQLSRYLGGSWEITLRRTTSLAGDAWEIIATRIGG